MQGTHLVVDEGKLEEAVGASDVDDVLIFQCRLVDEICRECIALQLPELVVRRLYRQFPI
jgi:hypothetical protein